MIEKDIRKDISERWVKAVDYLIQIGELKSYRELEEKTGIQNQRITLIKAFLRDSENNRPSYAHVDYIYQLADLFQINLYWIYFGEGSIIKGKEDVSFFGEKQAIYSTPMKEMEAKIEEMSKTLQKLINQTK